MLAAIFIFPKESNNIVNIKRDNAATHGVFLLGRIFESKLGISPSLAIPNNIRLMLISVISAVLAVAKSAAMPIYLPALYPKWEVSLLPAKHQALIDFRT